MLPLRGCNTVCTLWYAALTKLYRGEEGALCYCVADADARLCLHCYIVDGSRLPFMLEWVHAMFCSTLLLLRRGSTPPTLYFILYTLYFAVKAWIDAAYQHHPDRAGEGAAATFKRLQQAFYAILSYTKLY